MLHINVLDFFIQTQIKSDHLLAVLTAYVDEMSGSYSEKALIKNNQEWDFLVLLIEQTWHAERSGLSR